MENSVQEIIERWAGKGNQPWCEDWMYGAIRHAERNMEELCEHDDCNIPARYDGTAIAHAPSDIMFLLQRIQELGEKVNG